MMQLAYPFDCRKSDGEYIVSFVDIPEALTAATTKEEAVALARDALIAALGGYMEQKRDVPKPSPKKPRQLIAYLRPLEAAKLALYIAMRKDKLSNVGLASRLNVDEKTVRRMLDLDQATHIETIYAALRGVFNYRLVTWMEKAA